jgi:3-hydroxybutyryl-CoA dehydratase
VSATAGRTIHELAVGQKASFTKTISEHDVYAFAGITGDFNPVHVDAVAAAASPFGARVVHGMLTASLLSTVLGMHLPGPGAIYVSGSTTFKRPVFLGDTITAEVEVAELDVEKNRARFRTRCLNQHGKVVLEGESLLMPRQS